MSEVKLLHIITNLERGGAQKVLYDLICGLDKKEYEHHIIYFRHGPYVEKFKKLGIPIYGVRGLFTLYDPFFFNLYRLIKRLIQMPFTACYGQQMFLAELWHGC